MASLIAQAKPGTRPQPPRRSAALEAHNELMQTVLVVEDEQDIREALRRYLERAGLSVLTAATGTEALRLIDTIRPDLLLLDLGLPDIDGMDVLESAVPDIPVIVLTARTSVSDRIAGLRMGADDYVVKPFSPREVAARVRAILKRMAPRPVAEVSSALFRVDCERVQISYRNQPLNLTRHEFRLLQCLLEQPERVFSREQLLDALGVAADAGYERSIDSHIKSVRAKLRLVKADAEPIQTHRGLGYSYSPGHS